MQIRNSIALVTGANRGIGRALVNALLQAGAKKVYAGTRDLSSLNTAKFIDMARVVPISIDITNREGVRALPDKAPDVNLLINNAGVLDFGNIMPKTAPADIAAAVVAGIAAGQEDIFPDAMSAGLYAAWKTDHKSVEKQFAAM